MSRRILFVSETFPASRSVQRIAALRSLGHEVRPISITPPGTDYETPHGIVDRLRYRVRRPADRAGANLALIATAEKWAPDVIWLDNAKIIAPDTLRKARDRHPRPRLVWFSEDDMMNPRMGSVRLDASISLFDLWVTTKSFNAEPDEMPSRGARHVLFVDNGFDPEMHHPEQVTDTDRALLGAEISFIGTFEAPRAASLLTLANAGFSVRVWGNGWGRLNGAGSGVQIEGRPVYGTEFRKAIACSDINLSFLRKANRDRQTCRSIEIPACGGFMLHEHSDELARLFEPNRDAAYFDDDAGLVEACGRWLRDPSGRNRVAKAGHDRVRALGLDHASIMARILKELDEVR